MTRFNSILPYYLLCDFENSQKAKRSERGEAEGACTLPHVDPDHLHDGAEDDDAVKPVEGRAEVGGQAQGIHPEAHLEHKQTEEGKLSIIWNDKINVTLLFCFCCFKCLFVYFDMVQLFMLKPIFAVINSHMTL